MSKIIRGERIDARQVCGAMTGGDLTIDSGLAYRAMTIDAGHGSERIMMRSDSYVERLCGLRFESLLVAPDGSVPRRDGHHLGVMVTLHAAAEEAKFAHVWDATLTPDGSDRRIIHRGWRVVIDGARLIHGAIWLPVPQWGGEDAEPDQEIMEHNDWLLSLCTSMQLDDLELAVRLEALGIGADHES